MEGRWRVWKGEFLLPPALSPPPVGERRAQAAAPASAARWLRLEAAAGSPPGTGASQPPGGEGARGSWRSALGLGEGWSSCESSSWGKQAALGAPVVSPEPSQRSRGVGKGLQAFSLSSEVFITPDRLQDADLPGRHPRRW